MPDEDRANEGLIARAAHDLLGLADEQSRPLVVYCGEATYAPYGDAEWWGNVGDERVLAGRSEDQGWRARVDDEVTLVGRLRQARPELHVLDVRRLGFAHILDRVGEFRPTHVLESVRSAMGRRLAVPRTQPKGAGSGARDRCDRRYRPVNREASPSRTSRAGNIR